MVGEDSIGALDFQGRKLNSGFAYLNVVEWTEKGGSHARENAGEEAGEEAGKNGVLWRWKGLSADAGEDPELLRRVCHACSADPMEWVFRIDLDSYSAAVDILTGVDRPQPDPEITFEHYQYEHSSDWALPQYQDREEESFR